ncbi:MAG: MFS transporter, partial [Actinomycetota bacterium]|nr:MFS transporter [Actinomycetota bacterium]
GVVGFAQWLPWALFALPAGALADRFDRKRLMVVCDAVRAIAAGSIVGALLIGDPPFLQIAAAAFLDGSLLVTSYVCERGALRQVVTSDQLQDAVAQNETRTFTANIAGPPLGGVLFSLSRFLPFVADTISFLCSIAALSLTRSAFQPVSAAGPRPGRRAELAGGFQWLWRHPFFRTASLLFGAANPVFTGLYLLAILLAERHGATPAAVGAMLAVAGTGGVLGALAAPRLRRGISPRAAITAANWLLVAVVPLLLLAHAAIVIGLIVGAAEFPTPLVIAAVAGSRVAAAPDHLQGRVQAAATLLAMSLGWLGPLAIGLAFQQTGPTPTIMFVLGWALVLATVATLAPALRTDPK